MHDVCGMFPINCISLAIPLAVPHVERMSSGSQNVQRTCPGFGCALVPLLEKQQSGPFSSPRHARGMTAAVECVECVAVVIVRDAYAI